MEQVVALSPLGQKLLNDPEGIVRDQYCEEYAQLAQVIEEKIRQPLAKEEYEPLRGLLDSIELASSLVNRYWDLYHGRN